MHYYMLASFIYVRISILTTIEYIFYKGRLPWESRTPMAVPGCCDLNLIFINLATFEVRNGKKFKLKTKKKIKN